jgi:ABC-type sugar transport system permease subunit
MATVTAVRSHRARAVRRRRASARQGRWAGYGFIGPLLLVFAVFYLWPTLATVLSSLFRWSLLRPWRATDSSTWEYVGWDNYRQTLTDDAFWNAAVNSLLWLVIFPVLVTGFSLLVAILVWNVRRLAGVFRTVFILPMTISLAAAGVIWSFVYNSDPDVGVLNAVLRALHLDFAVDWGPLRLATGQWLSDIGSLDLGFAEIHLVNLSLIIAAFWAFTGFGVVTFTAGLSSLPAELVDSAKVDGCGARQLTRHVVIPHLRRPMLIVYVVSVIFALRTFDIVYVMTKGGPGEDSMVLALLLWQEAFAFLTEPKAGQATAIAVLMTVVLIALAYPYLRNMLRRTGRAAG